MEDPPLQDMVERMRERGGSLGGMPAGESGAPEDDLFVREDASQLSTEAVWRAIESDSERGSEAFGPEDLESVEVVPKRWYCEQCEYFSDPPGVHCLNEGTRIVEFVNNEHVRVENCPVVAERKAIGQFEPDE